MPNPRFSRFFPRWLIFLAWAITLAWLSLIPNPPEIKAGFFGWDKFQHAAAYGVLTLFAGWAFACFPCDVKRCWLRAVLAAVSFGGLLEIAQGLFTKTRAAEFGDLAADFVGAACMYAIMMAAFHRRNT